MQRLYMLSRSVLLSVGALADHATVFVPVQYQENRDRHRVSSWRPRDDEELLQALREMVMQFRAAALPVRQIHRSAASPNPASHPGATPPDDRLSEGA